MTYALPEGTSYSKRYRSPPMSRTTLWLDEEEIPGAPVARPLADTSIFTTFAPLHGSYELYVERAMWWGGVDGFIEGHVSQGARAGGTSWGVADGAAGGPRHAVTYLLVGNVSATSAPVRVRLYFEDGSTAERMFTVAGGSRFNVDVGTEFPEAVGRRFGAVVDSVGDPPASIIVERSMYEDAGGVRWAAGTNVVATRLR